MYRDERDDLRLWLKPDLLTLTNSTLLRREVLWVTVRAIKPEFPKHTVSSWLGVPSRALGVHSLKCINLRMKSVFVKHWSRICCFLFIVRQGCSAQHGPVYPVSLNRLMSSTLLAQQQSVSLSLFLSLFQTQTLTFFTCCIIVIVLERKTVHSLCLNSASWLKWMACELF